MGESIVERAHSGTESLQVQHDNPHQEHAQGHDPISANLRNRSSYDFLYKLGACGQTGTLERIFIATPTGGCRRHWSPVPSSVCAHSLLLGRGD